MSLNCLLSFAGKLIWHLLPALTTVVISGILIQRFYVRRANASAFVDNILKELQILRSDSISYWTVKEEGKDSILTSQMKASIQTIYSDLNYYCEQYKLKHNMKLIFENKLILLSDAATGGNFEQKSRKLDSSRCYKIVNAVNALRSELHKTKI